MTSGNLRVALAQYDIGTFQHWNDYQAKIIDWVTRASDQGAKLLVFPEYFSMELVSLFAPEVQRSLPLQIEHLQGLLPPFMELFCGLAAKHDTAIVAGSFPVRIDSGQFRNRSYLFRAEGIHFQEKLQMTRFENEIWGIHPGETARVFATQHGTWGINVCYDAEFPLIARKQVEAGAEIIIVPSCTDTVAGHHRVRIACQARALEGQCYVLQAPTVGTALWSPAVDVNVGQAGVFGPPDTGFPDNGVIAEGAWNVPQWLLADLDLARVHAVRANGKVLNHRDWPGQVRA